MRKEAKIGIFVSLVLVTLIANFDALFNVIAKFFLTGIIPGTSIAIPSIVVFAITILAISAMITRALMPHLPEKLSIKTIRGRFIQIEIQQKSSV